MGEQGAESIHTHLMRLERAYQGIPNELDTLKYIFKEQALESAPLLTCLRPPLKKGRRLQKIELQLSIIYVSSDIVLFILFLYVW